MSEPKWKTRAYTITGWIGFGLFLLVVIVDIGLAVLKRPTLSQYVTARYTDQPIFGYIVIGVLIWLGIHWFGKMKKS